MKNILNTLFAVALISTQTTSFAQVNQPRFVQNTIPSALPAVSIEDQLKNIVDGYTKALADADVAKINYISVQKAKYIIELEKAEARATSASDLAALKLILQEKDFLNKNPFDFVAGVPQGFPAYLLVFRNTYITELNKVKASFATRLNQLLVDYIKNLGIVDVRAKSINNTSIISEVAALKLKALNGIQVAPVSNQAKGTVSTSDTQSVKKIDFLDGTEHTGIDKVDGKYVLSDGFKFVTEIDSNKFKKVFFEAKIKLLDKTGIKIYFFNEQNKIINDKAKAVDNIWSYGYWINNKSSSQELSMPIPKEAIKVVLEVRFFGEPKLDFSKMVLNFK